MEKEWRILSIKRLIELTKLIVNFPLILWGRIKCNRGINNEQVNDSSLRRMHCQERMDKPCQMNSNPLNQNTIETQRI